MMELDRQVAERVMGWKEGRDFVIDGGHVRRLLHGILPSNVWSPTTNIVDAWQVVDEMAYWSM